MDKLPETFEELVDLAKIRYGQDPKFVTEFNTPEKLDKHIGYEIRHWLLCSMDADEMIDAADGGDDFSWIVDPRVKCFDRVIEVFTDWNDPEDEEIIEEFLDVMDNVWFQGFSPTN